MTAGIFLAWGSLSTLSQGSGAWRGQTGGQSADEFPLMREDGGSVGLAACATASSGPLRQGLLESQVRNLLCGLLGNMLS